MPFMQKPTPKLGKLPKEPEVEAKEIKAPAKRARTPAVKPTPTPTSDGEVEKELLPVRPKAPEAASPEVEALRAELATLKAQVAMLGQAPRAPWNIPTPAQLITWCRAHEAHDKSAGMVVEYWPIDKDYPERGGRLSKGGGWKPPAFHLAEVYRAMKEEYERGAG